MDDSDPLVHAIRTAILEDSKDSIMVGDIVLIAEIFPENGEPTMLSTSNSEMPILKELGMLEFRLQVVGRVIEHMGDSDE